ncbi:MAG: hypothetical protein HC908_13150 [Calothrix sp. SM1_7_51]|nr:hypothetical protein [Calothrix sp. SM1_7_51]
MNNERLSIMLSYINRLQEIVDELQSQAAGWIKLYPEHHEIAHDAFAVIITTQTITAAINNLKAYCDSCLESD